MEITSVEVKRVKTPGKMKANAGITIDNAFAIHDIKVIETEKGRFIAMPNRRRRGGTGYIDIAHPISHEVREEMERRIFEEYDKLPEEESE